jgi:hypothetical protein
MFQQIFNNIFESHPQPHSARQSHQTIHTRYLYGITITSHLPTETMPITTRSLNSSTHLSLYQSSYSKLSIYYQQKMILANYRSNWAHLKLKMRHVGRVIVLERQVRKGWLLVIMGTRYNIFCFGEGRRTRTRRKMRIGILSLHGCLLFV